MVTRRGCARMLVLLTMLVAVTAQGAVAPPKKTPDVPQPYTRAWRYETPAMTTLRASADAGIVVVSLVDGRLVALDPDDGSLLWSADFGGQVSAPPLVTTTAIFVATSRQ